MSVSFLNDLYLCGGKIHVYGNHRFQQEILEYVHELKTTYVGRELFRRLSSEEVIHIVSGGGSFVDLSDRKIININSYEAENSQLIALNEKNEKIFHKSKGCVVLAHEFIHILHFQKGLFLTAIPSSDPDFTNLEEELTITGHAGTIYDPICEQAIDDAFHLPRRISHMSSIFSQGEDPYERCHNTGETRMHDAAYWGVIPQLKFFLNQGANLGIQDNSQKTPLHHAASHSIESVRFLLDNSADINAVDGFGYTPLFWAIANNQIEIVRELLHRGASSSQIDNSGNSPWITAVWNGNLDIIQAFIDYEVDLHQQNPFNGRNALHYAKKPEVLTLLIDQNMNVNFVDFQGVTPLHLVAVAGKIDLVGLLIKYGKAEINTFDMFGNSPLSLAELLGKYNVSMF